MQNPEERNLKIPGLPHITTPGELNQFRPVLEWVALIMSRRQPPETLPRLSGEETLFFLQGDPVLEILGDTTPAQLEREEGFFAFDREAFTILREDNTLLFQAEKPGYLAWGLEGLTLVEPTFLRGDRQIIFRDLPLKEGTESLKTHLSTLVRDHRRLYIHPDIHVLTPESAALLVKGSPKDHVLIDSPGSEPGRDGSLKILVCEEKPILDENQRVDYRDFHSYMVAREGDQLAELHHPFPGKPGVNLYGEENPVTPGKEIVFHAGDNVKEVVQESTTCFIAAVDGLVQMKSSSVSVSEAMIVPGDVDLKTGNVDFMKDVLIKGSVTENFIVSAGGDLIVEGLIAAGAEVTCGGSLTVMGGIIGASTRVKAAKDGRINFIQDAGIYCEGSLTVMKYALNAHLFAGDSLNVMGQGLNANHRAVEGGSATAMRAMNLASAGSEMRETALTAGYNPYVERTLARIGEALGALELQISSLMNRFGCGSDMTVLLERIRRMAPLDRQKVREALARLKEYIQKREELLAERNRKQAALYYNDPERLHIQIEGRLEPKVHIRLIDEILLVEHPDNGSKFRLLNGEIVKD